MPALAQSPERWVKRLTLVVDLNPSPVAAVLELTPQEEREVARANEGLAPVEQVRKFRLLDKELDHDDNEVTATMKVRRKTIYEKFAPLIREIYQ